MRPETLAVHAGLVTDPHSGAVVPPLVLATTFARSPDNALLSEFVYSRHDNPNRQTLERSLAALEASTPAGQSSSDGQPGTGPVTALAFASGLASTLALFHSLSAGDHVLAPVDIYYGVRAQLEGLYTRWGLQMSFVDMTDLDAVAQSLRPNTRLVWTETPSNPRLKITNLRSVADLAHRAGAICACDNTWAPLIQRPLDLGADVVMYSTTKYFGGHSDVLGGALITTLTGPSLERLRSFQTLGGAVPAPFDCWLLSRSLRTLPQRLAAHCANAARVADFLNQHPAVAATHYPGLPGHPGHALAAAQMTQFGGMVSIELRGGQPAAMAVLEKVKLFTRATSLGGVESLIEHRASVEGNQSPTPPSLLRLSVGLEHPDDLIEDLAQALES